MWNSVVKVVEFVVRDRTQQLAFSALILSALFTAVIAIIVGGVFDNNIFRISAPDAHRWIVAGTFSLSFLVIWFLMYVQFTREADDIYSRLREKLEGIWIVSYEIKNGIGADQVLGRPVVGCIAVINKATRKLELKFNIKDNPIYADSEQIINNVAIRHEKSQTYNLFYYYKGYRDINFEVAKYVAPPEGRGKPGKIEVEIVGLLSFEEQLGEQKIKTMTGNWFDLNGNVIKLFALYDLICDERNLGRELSAIALDDVPINHGNFSASMGEITYTR